MNDKRIKTNPHRKECRCFYNKKASKLRHLSNLREEIKFNLKIIKLHQRKIKTTQWKKMGLKIKLMGSIENRFKWSIYSYKTEWSQKSIWEKIWGGDKIVIWLSHEEIPAINVSTLFFMLSQLDTEKVEVLQTYWW